MIPLSEKVFPVSNAGMIVKIFLSLIYHLRPDDMVSGAVDGRIKTFSIIVRYGTLHFYLKIRHRPVNC